MLHGNFGVVTYRKEVTHAKDDDLESVRELWDELDPGLYDRRTLAIVGLVDLVGARSRRNRRAWKSRCALCWRIS